VGATQWVAIIRDIAKQMAAFTFLIRTSRIMAPNLAVYDNVVIVRKVAGAIYISNDSSVLACLLVSKFTSYLAKR